MKVRDVMSSPAVTVGPAATFGEVVDRLLAHDISGLPVVDDGGRLLGMITEADLVSKEAYGYRRRRALGLVAEYLRGHDPQWVRKGAARTARDLMTAAPAAASPDEDLATAARRMLELRHKRLPVVEAGRVVGVVARHDLLKPLHRSDAELAGEVEALLGDVRRAPDSHGVSVAVHDGVVTLEGTALRPSDIAVIDAVVGHVPGVVGVDDRIVALEPEPRLSRRP
jgi:CBS domain-containing protein